MKRLFIAIGAMTGIQNEAQLILKKLRIHSDRRELDAKWSKLENLHITLSFLGDVDETRLFEITAAMNRAAQHVNSFNLQIRGMNGFPSLHSARSIYLDVQRSQNLLDLQSAVEGELNQIGFNLDNKHYVPHLTIGRLRNPRSIEDMISPFVRKQVGKIEVNEIVLYESVQSGPYTVYKKISTAKIPVQEKLQNHLDEAEILQ
jgi:2'-5' RNA ligase